MHRIRIKSAFIVCLPMLFLFVGLAFIQLPVCAKGDTQSKPLIIYFYSSVCESCNIAEKSLNEVYAARNESGSKLELDIRMYNIEKKQNYELFQKYLDFYMVAEQDRRTPIIFFGSTYYAGKSEILQGLKKEFSVDNIQGAELLKLSGEDQKRVWKQFSGMGAINVLLTGLVAGFNPCSLSMLLFFISLITARKANVLKMGIAFGIGKFTTYLLLGSVLYNLLSKLHGSWFGTFTKIALLVFVLVIAGLSIKDFFTAREEKYNKITNQLPVGLRKFNHKWIKKITSGSNIKLLVFMCALLGVVISAGEFLCTGQIYVATIAYIIQSNTVLTLKAFLYLLLYDMAFILPLIIIIVVIDRGKDIFDVSEILRKKLPAIKLVTGLTFLILGVFIIFWV